MKKSLIALAAVAATGAVMAQSSVTVYGVMDTSVAYVKGAKNVSGLLNSGNATSRLGFKGVEDLGNGLKAEFVLEGEVFPDNGGASGLNFKRQSTVGLSSSEFGQVRLGRALTAAYNAVSRYDTFGTVGLGATSAWSGAQTGYNVRSDNMVSYISPKFAGFGIGVDYGFGEQTSNRTARTVGFGATYDNGPLSLGLGYDQQNNVTSANAAVPNVSNKDLKTLSVGGSYDFGVAKLAGFYKETKYEPATGTAATSKLKTWNLGVSAPVGAAGVVKASFNNYKLSNSSAKADQFALGYVHSLSKRTAVYGTYAYLKNKNSSTMTLNGVYGADGFGAGAVGLKNDKKQQGIQVGVRHAF